MTDRCSRIATRVADLLQVWVGELARPCHRQRRHEGELSMRVPLRAMMILPLAGLLLSGPVLLPVREALLWASPAHAEQFTGEQRAEIVNIVRDALKKDPSILRDAVIALQADDGEREKVASRAAVLANRDILISPRDPVGGNPHGSVTI